MTLFMVLELRICICMNLSVIKTHGEKKTFVSFTHKFIFGIICFLGLNKSPKDHTRPQSTPWRSIVQYKVNFTDLTSGQVKTYINIFLYISNLSNTEGRRAQQDIYRW